MGSFPEVSCDTCFGYSPREESEVGETTRRFCYALKRGEERAILWASDQAKALAADGHFRGCLGADVTLVPMPGHAPRKNEEDRWIGLQLATALAERELGADVLPILVRTEKVPKSAFATPAQRPSAQVHYDALEVSTLVRFAASGIAVVEDVLTRGATMLAAVARLREAFPKAGVRGFAMIRTQHDLGGKFVHPVRHTISPAPWGAHRTP